MLSECLWYGTRSLRPSTMFISPRYWNMCSHQLLRVIDPSQFRVWQSRLWTWNIHSSMHATTTHFESGDLCLKIRLVVVGVVYLSVALPKCIIWGIICGVSWFNWSDRLDYPKKSSETKISALLMHRRAYPSYATLTLGMHVHVSRFYLALAISVMRVELLILLSSCIEYIAGQNNVTSAALGWNLKMLQGLSSQCTWNSGEASKNTGHALRIGAVW